MYTQILFTSPRAALEIPARTLPCGDLDVGELRGWVAERVADYKRLADVVITERIPKNPSGKILRRELRAQAS